MSFNTDSASLTPVLINGEVFFRMANTGAMRPFLMSIVSHSDHWLFIASNGGITAGRKNPDSSLFPYYTDDKVTDNAELTGSKTIIRVQKENAERCWEPFSIRQEGLYSVTRNIYKNRTSNKIIFEEINQDLSLCFRYEWNFSSRFGFIKKSSLRNLSDGPVQVTVADGIQNIIPYGVGSDLQTRVSNLADAYKRAELDTASGIGLFALSAIIADKAEPSEALKTTIAWSTGLEQPVYLLSALQLPAFRQGLPVQTETDCKGERGAYFTVASFELAAAAAKEWMLVADVNQRHAAVIALAKLLAATSDIAEMIREDIAAGTAELLQLISHADGIQVTADTLQDTRHISNVLFNCMRGGIFDQQYTVSKKDFTAYLQAANNACAATHTALLQQWPEQFSCTALIDNTRSIGDAALLRLAMEYLPLRFSRRHGDPSRPWNKFSINLLHETDGSKLLDYEGNWRDIFQNWEALAHAYPLFTRNMITKFLNASTFDGYNPYRVMKNGFDWETIEPDDPWSYIGYWGDHQLIYLLKLLECQEQFFPGTLEQSFGESVYVYAHVPYRIKSYRDIVQDPKNTIDFDHAADKKIRARIDAIGFDGALLTNAQQQIQTVTFIEKILATTLSKLSNLVPGAGIWMNTQRPEWNDANNALVGNGVSMVTLCYLHRFLQFFLPLLERNQTASWEVSVEMSTFCRNIHAALHSNEPFLHQPLSDMDRKRITTALGEAGSDFRSLIHDNGFSGHQTTLPASMVLALFRLALVYTAHTIRCNRREDQLYHSYSLLYIRDDGFGIQPLDEMLEGQVAVLSTGSLEAGESLALLDALRNSKLYRADQQSYLLYPDKELPGFLQRNNIPASLVNQSALLQLLLQQKDSSILEQDIAGQYHFNGNFRNAGDLLEALKTLPAAFKPLAEQEREKIAGIFETVFNHKAFTGRSGTFYGYEGLGSIYWHMVSKLLLAVQETCLRAMRMGTDAAIIHQLVNHYYTIKAGIGVHKSPQLYGAFPTDPYSHTPRGKGAQQPGMTGQVKEDILCRIGETGMRIQDGKIGFDPVLLRSSEFIHNGTTAAYYDTTGNRQTLQLEAPALFFTCCGTPVIYTPATEDAITIHRTDGSSTVQQGCWLQKADSDEILERKGTIRLLAVQVSKQKLRS